VSSSMGGIVVALIAHKPAHEAREASKQARETAEVAANAIGVPNGKGNLVQMAEKLLEGQADILTRVGAVEGSVNNLTGAAQALDRRMVILEDGCPLFDKRPE